MSAVQRFKAKLTAANPEMGAWTTLDIPPTVSKRWGVRGRIRLAGTVNGFTVATSAMPDGAGGHQIMFNKTMQAGAKAKAGDTVECVLGPAGEEQEAKVPAALAKALKTSKPATLNWKAFTPTQRREYVAWIDEAKKDETKAARVAKTVERVAQGIKRFD